MKRRTVLTGGAGLASGALLPSTAVTEFDAMAGQHARLPSTRALAPLRGLADEPLRSVDLSRHIAEPVLLERVELLQIRPREILIVGHSRDGVQAIVPANARLGDDLSMFTQRVLPFFLARDQRDIELTIAACHRAHYKLAGLSFWNAVGHLDMLALEMLGQVAQRSVAELLGGRRREDVSVYLSSRERSTTPEQEIDEFMLPRLASSGAVACKLGIGGRMSRNEDAAPGRSEALVTRARRVLGDDIDICVDANGSYDGPAAVEVGRMLERHGVWFFEEPCPFEEFDLALAVSQRLAVKVAGGEQDHSAAKWRWMIENRAVDIVQPDLFYAGGFLRSLRVARLAEQHGLEVIPHAPRAHAATATLLQFVALLERPGRHHEFSARAITASAAYDYEPQLRVAGGRIPIPGGAGFGIHYDLADLRRRSTPIPVESRTRQDDE